MSDIRFKQAICRLNAINTCQEVLDEQRAKVEAEIEALCLELNGQEKLPLPEGSEP